MNVKFSLLKDTNGKEFSDILAIYEELFPNNERQPNDVFAKRIVSGQTELLIATDETQTLGFAVLWNFTYSNFALLDYFGVKKGLQNSGIGTRMMQNVLRIAKKWNKDLVLEVERPGEGENLEEREKRLRFYLKNGALILQNVPYRLPSLDNSVPIPMILMTVPLTLTTHYSGTQIKALIEQIYRAVYNRTCDDKVLQSFIRDIPETIELTNIWH